MSSTPEYRDYVLGQLSYLDGITYRPMMGEYILYYRGKIIGGIYDDQFLVKPVAAARRLLPEGELVTPYEGAREMLLVDRLENKDFLRELIENMDLELPKARTKSHVKLLVDQTKSVIQSGS